LPCDDAGTPRRHTAARNTAVSRLLWILVIGGLLALVVAVVRPDGGAIAGLSADDIGATTYHVALAVFIGGAVLVMFRERISKALEALLFWVLIGFVLVFAYSYRGELRDAGERVMAEIVPGRPAVRNAHTVEIVRGRGGDFQVAAQINGTRVAMTLDTGASAVVLTQEAAKAAGLPLEVLSYSVQVDTANGRARAASVTLDRLAVGNIVELAVPALVAQPGQLRVSLLGMSFLNRLESWEVRGDRLVMRGYP
jgi:aspartyl protease family protein